MITEADRMARWIDFEGDTEVKKKTSLGMRGRDVHEMQQENDENWSRDTEEARSIDSVTIRSFIFNYLWSVIIPRLETGSMHKRCRIAYKINAGNDSNLVPLSYT